MTRGGGPIVPLLCLLHLNVFMHVSMFTQPVFTLGTVHVTRDGGPIVLKFCLQHLGLFMYVAMLILNSLFRHSLCDQKLGPHSAQIVFTTFMLVYATMLVIHVY